YSCARRAAELRRAIVVSIREVCSKVRERKKPSGHWIVCLPAESSYQWLRCPLPMFEVSATTIDRPLLLLDEQVSLMRASPDVPDRSPLIVSGLEDTRQKMTLRQTRTPISSCGLLSSSLATGHHIFLVGAWHVH